ncbi:hypothetical protein J6590_009988 [Homalodisca vitripennis]|nr:hypothetical protein J6590_009988 [Homalodisca vitripennis]
MPRQNPSDSEAGKESVSINKCSVIMKRGPRRDGSVSGSISSGSGCAGFHRALTYPGLGLSSFLLRPSLTIAGLLKCQTSVSEGFSHAGEIKRLIWQTVFRSRKYRLRRDKCAGEQTRPCRLRNVSNIPVLSELQSPPTSKRRRYRCPVWQLAKNSNPTSADRDPFSAIQPLARSTGKKRRENSYKTRSRLAKNGGERGSTATCTTRDPHSSSHDALAGRPDISCFYTRPNFRAGEDCVTEWAFRIVFDKGTSAFSAAKTRTVNHRSTQVVRPAVYLWDNYCLQVA